MGRCKWSSETATVATFVWRLTAAGIAVHAMGQDNADDEFRTVLIVFVSTKALRRLSWKPSGSSEAIDQAAGNEKPQG
jgi:hypothetical protein